MKVEAHPGPLLKFINGKLESTPLDITHLQDVSQVFSRLLLTSSGVTFYLS